MPVDAIRDVLFAAAVAGPLALLNGRAGRPRAWAMALALAAGYWTTRVRVLGWPELPPADSHARLAVVAAAAGVAALLATLLPRGAGWIAVAAVAVAAPRYLVKAPSVPAPLLVSLGASTLLPLLAVETYVRRFDGPAPPLALAVVACGAAKALEQAHAAIFAQLAGALAAALVAVAVVALVRRRTTLHGGAVAVPLVLLPALLAAAHFYADLREAPAILLAAAPLLMWGGATTLGGWGAPVACAIPVTIAIFLAQPDR